MSKRKYNHLHKYKKVMRGKQTVFKCMQPGCPHFIDYNLAENALCACNRCDESMILTRVKMQLVKPHCDNCVKRKDPVKVDRINKLAELFATNDPT